MAKQKAQKKYPQGRQRNKQRTERKKKATKNNETRNDDDEQPDAQPTVSIAQTCDIIAELSESVLEDPQKAFKEIQVEQQQQQQSSENNKDDESTPRKRKYPSKMTQLLTIARQQETESQQYTAELAVLSLLAIFKDIRPNYRIRVPTASERAIRVTKETKQLWDYERLLLVHYQQYLKLLERTYSESSKQRHQRHGRLSMTCMLSLAELLKSSFHFNFRSNLIAAVVRQSNSHCQPIRQACCDAIQYVFANDTQGEVAMEVTRQLAKFIKDRFFKVAPDTVRCFLRLPLRVHADEAQAAQLASQARAKKRKRDREAAEIESELQESRATVDKLVLARCQSDTLQAVILTYFKILKSEQLESAHIQALLPATLEGLAKFAHLINIDTVVDLLAVLRDLLQKVDALPLDASLNCILTAFLTLQGPGKEMKIDQKEYIVPLYNQLPRLCSEQNSTTNTDTVIKILNMAFVKRREYSTVRVAAFMKQLLATALHTPNHTSVPLIAFARQLIQWYPSAAQLLENEQDVVTSGAFSPDVQDPEQSNPFATSAWELAMLKFHWSDTVSNQAACAATAKMLQLPMEGTERLRATEMRNMEELFIPFKRNKKRHPLELKATAKERSGRRQVRFVKPREFVSVIGSKEECD